MKTLVTGAGGFIGGHLVRYLKERGHWVRGVDIKPHEFMTDQFVDDFFVADLRDPQQCMVACEDIDWVFHLAADMGGIGYITSNHRKIFINSAKINMNMLDAAHSQYVERYLFSSSACVYPQYLQKKEDVEPLRETDAYPADPEPGYGWEKLFAELANQYYCQDTGLKTYLPRIHNAYGPFTAYKGGKEKAPAAICRKVAMAEDGGSIEIWGDGKQTRTFTFVDDVVEGFYRLIKSDWHQPVNIGYDKLITINEVVELVLSIAGKKLHMLHDTTKPQGVRGRSSDNTLVKTVLDWEPSVSYEEGFKKTYKWIESMVKCA